MVTKESAPDDGFGAYGLEVRGAPAPDELTPLPAGAGWPSLTLELQPDGGPPASSDGVTVMPTWHEQGGWIAVDPERGSATIAGAAASDPSEVTHPWLAWIAQAHAWALGRAALHAGGVILNGDAWALLAPSGWGKTTTLGALHGRGDAVLADDVLVLDGAEALAGPRALDLRPSRGAAFPGAQPVRGGERERVILGPTPVRARLAGLVHLTWGDRLELRRLDAAGRARLLNGVDAWRAPVRHHDQVLELLALPAFELRRSYGELELERVLEHLDDVAAESG